MIQAMTDHHGRFCPELKPIEGLRSPVDLDEFLWLYDVVFVQNRDMEHALGILTRELKELEEENVQLLVEKGSMFFIAGSVSIVSHRE
jgi:hypothetical protein